MTYNQFDGISKSRIHQTTKGLAQFRRQLLCCKAQKGSKRDDGDKVEDKDQGGIPVQSTSNDAKRHKDEQNIDIVADEDFPNQVDYVLGY